MNDRSQGGTSIAPGTVELMQNRAAPSDDAKGVGEPLQEKDEYGNGIRVIATYYVQICDGVHRLPLQRVAQHKINDPANYFFNFDLAETKEPTLKDELSEAYKAAGIVDTVKAVLIPRAKNLVHVRLENLADLYDSNSQAYTVSLSSVANALWAAANKLKPVPLGSVQITELSLSGNMLLEEMQARRIHWKTVDDAKTGATQHYAADDCQHAPDCVKLEPQRIRVFAMEFTPASDDAMFLQ